MKKILSSILVAALLMQSICINAVMADVTEYNMDIDNIVEENEDVTAEVYKDKLQKVISNDDFNIFYEKLQKEKNKLIVEIHQTESKIQEIEKENKKLDYKLIKKIANELLLSEQPTREQYSKLVEKIEFDSQKNIKVTFTFGQMIDKEELKKAV